MKTPFLKTWANYGGNMDQGTYYSSKYYAKQHILRPNKAKSAYNINFRIFLTNTYVVQITISTAYFNSIYANTFNYSSFSVFHLYYKHIYMFH